MRIERERAFIELVAGPEEDEFSIAASVGEFAGHNPSFGIEAGVLRKFVDDLRALERDRRGEARLASAMSPETLDLSIRVIDTAGHVTARAVIGRGRYDGHHYFRSSVTVETPFDPTSLPRLLLEAERLL